MIHDYYHILSKQQADTHTTYRVALNPDCCVYEGHFPGEPISPGVCNINMLRELLEDATGQALMLSYIQQCRLTTLVTPIQHSEVVVTIDILAAASPETPVYKFRGSIGNGTDLYLDLKGEASLRPAHE